MDGKIRVQGTMESHGVDYGAVGRNQSGPAEAVPAVYSPGFSSIRGQGEGDSSGLFNPQSGIRQGK
jgi:hypothetical protein